MMTNDIVITESANQEQTKELTFDELPPLLPQQAIMLNNILSGQNYTEAYRNAGYTSIEHADKAAWILITRNPLKAHLGYFRSQIAKDITTEWKQGMLRRIAENAIGNDKEIAIKAIQELNKMQGDYAATSVNVNTVNATIDDVRRTMLEYKKEY